MTVQDKSPHTPEPELPSDLGLARTVMAADRNLMAWVRTALAMLSFSFTIYRFLEGFEAERLLAGRHIPQNVGLFLAGMGTAAVLIGTIEYRITLKDLKRVGRFSVARPVFYIAILLCISGAALFVSILFRLF